MKKFSWRLPQWLPTTRRARNTAMFRLFPFILLLLLASCNRKMYEPTYQFQPTRLQEDFRIFQGALEAQHPSLYWYTSKARLDSAFAITAQQLNTPMTEREFLRLLLPLVEQVHCAHTDILPSEDYLIWRAKNPGSRLPFTIFESENKIYINNNLSSDSTLTFGTELVSIESKPAIEVFRSFKSVEVTDGYNQTGKNMGAQQAFRSRYNIWYGHKNQYTVEIKDLSGKSITRIISYKEKKTSAEQSSASKEPENSAILSKDHLYFTIDDQNKDLAVLKIVNFSGNYFPNSLRKVFTYIQEKGISHLIIDLRDNFGGRPAYGNLLIKYLMSAPFQPFTYVHSKPMASTKYNRYIKGRLELKINRLLFSRRNQEGGWTPRGATAKKKPKKTYSFNGNVYLLTNGNTYSTASIIAANLQYWKRAVIVGEETGGGRWGLTGWKFATFVLPATQVRVIVPLYKSLTAVTGTNQGRGVMPDYPVEMAYKNVIHQKDLCKDKVRKLIRLNSASKSF